MKDDTKPTGYKKARREKNKARKAKKKRRESDASCVYITLGIAWQLVQPNRTTYPFAVV
jgi:hypothetical protein